MTATQNEVGGPVVSQQDVEVTDAEEACEEVEERRRPAERPRA